MAKYKNDIDKELFERIEAYIRDRMDADTRVAFEKEMRSDESLNREVMLQRRLMASVEVFAFNENEAGKQPATAIPVRRIGPRLSYVAAAAAVVLIVLLIWFNRTSKPSIESLYADHFTADAGLPVVMSSVDENYAFYDGMVSYKEGDYSGAISRWREIDNTSDTLSYYIGVAYLNSNNAAASIEYLSPVAENGGSAWQQKAIWYLALAHLKENNTTAAIDLLNRLQDYEQAKRLKKDIENL